MKTGKVIVGILAWGLLAALFSPSPLQGAQGREFAGFYQVSGVTQNGNVYQLTFMARVFNYSGADISDANITLAGRRESRQPYARFSGIFLPSRGSTVVSGSVRIPSREYRLWQRGAQPRLLIAFTDAQGHNRLEPVLLARRPVH